MKESIDFAKTLLHSLRFNFPRIVLGVAFFRRDPDTEDSRAVEKLLLDHARKLFPPSTGFNFAREEAHFLDTTNSWASYGLYTICEPFRSELAYSENCHLKLLRTISSYAGQTLGIPSIVSDEYRVPFDVNGECPDLDVSPETRWYWYLWDQGRFNTLEIDRDNVIRLEVCENALGESWALLNEMMTPRSGEPAIEVFDNEEQQIIDLISSVGHRMTTTQLLSEFERTGSIKAESTIKGKLGRMVKVNLLTNRQDVRPHKGYGLPDWE